MDWCSEVSKHRELTDNPVGYLGGNSRNESIQVNLIKGHMFKLPSSDCVKIANNILTFTVNGHKFQLC